MKVWLIPIVFFVCCMCFSGLANAQGIPVSSAELSKVVARAEELLSKTPFRVKMTADKAKKFEDGWTFYSYQETEEIRPGIYRNKQHTGNRTETIIIDSTVYSRRGEGPWMVKAPPQRDTTPHFEDVSKLDLKIYKSGNETILGNVASKYEINSKVDKMNLSTRSVDQWTSKIIYWFDADGRFLKIESTSYQPPQNEFVRQVRIYEYDSGIKIDAPMM